MQFGNFKQHQILSKHTSTAAVDEVCVDEVSKDECDCEQLKELQSSVIVVVCVVAVVFVFVVGVVVADGVRI